MKKIGWFEKWILYWILQFLEEMILIRMPNDAIKGKFGLLIAQLSTSSHHLKCEKSICKVSEK